jgi:hypothetical protein
MHSHSGEAGFTQLWWIQGTSFAALTAVGMDKITKRHLQLDILFFHPDSIFWFLIYIYERERERERESRITMATIYYQYICPRKHIV